MKIVLQKSTGEILSAFSGIEPDEETLLGNHSNIDSSDLEVKSVTPEEHGEITHTYLKTTPDGYKILRLAEYPSLQECVHAILDDDLVALQEKRQTIKTKYPKG